MRIMSNFFYILGGKEYVLIHIQFLYENLLEKKFNQIPKIEFW